jgi:hypothetical protein
MILFLLVPRPRPKVLFLRFFPVFSFFLSFLVIYFHFYFILLFDIPACVVYSCAISNFPSKLSKLFVFLSFTYFSLISWTKAKRKLQNFLTAVKMQKHINKKCIALSKVLVYLNRRTL